MSMALGAEHEMEVRKMFVELACSGSLAAGGRRILGQMTTGRNLNKKQENKKFKQFVSSLSSSAVS